MENQTRPPIVRDDRRSWFERNWKWFVPSMLMGGLALSAAMVALVFVAVFAAIKSSGAYGQSLARVQENPDAQAALGTPIEAGYFITGNISVNGPSGRADLGIPVFGPKDAGMIYSDMHKSGGVWSFNKLVLTVTGSGETLDLLE